MNNIIKKISKKKILFIGLVFLLIIATVATLIFTGVIDIGKDSANEENVDENEYDFGPYTDKPLELSRDSEIIKINGVECNLSMTCSEFCKKTGIKFANEVGDINTQSLSGKVIECFSFADEFGKTNSIWLENQNSKNANLANCILKGFSYEYSDDYENPTTFEWNGITQDSTYDKILSVLGAPGDEDAFSLSTNGNLEISYDDNKSRGYISVVFDKDKKIKKFLISFMENFDFGSYKDKPLKISKDSEMLKINGIKCNLSMTCSEFCEKTGIKFENRVGDINTETLYESENCLCSFSDEFCGYNMIELQQQNSKETKLADCKVIGFFYDNSTGYENPITFEWNGITQDSTLDDVLKVLGAPGDDDYYSFSANDNSLELNYFSDNDGTVCICFDDANKKLTEFSIECH